MKKTTSLLTVLMFVGMGWAVSGCASTQKGYSSQSKVALCTGCGQIKGDAKCCKPDQKLCGGCGLVKGSPGCCKITKGSEDPVFLCASCGHIKGDAKCCKPGQTKCKGCSLVKGSPGCCKMGKKG